MTNQPPLPVPDRTDATTADAMRHAFDPTTQPHLFRDVRRRRIMAFGLDLLIIGAFVVAAAFVVFIFGILTFGLGWMLFAALVPTVAVLYVAFTVGARQATWGMRSMGLTLRMWYGGKPDFWIGAAHAVLFWASSGLLPFLVLLPPLFDSRKRMLHDMVLGTVLLDEASARGVT
jgi:uncharacterized RDD family membrane protein YckC